MWILCCEDEEAFQNDSNFFFTFKIKTKFGKNFKVKTKNTQVWITMMNCYVQ